MKKNTPAQLARLLYEFTVDSENVKRIDEAVLVFLQYLKKERIVWKLPYIVDSFTQYAEEKEGKLKVSIASAKKLEGSTVNSVLRMVGATDIREQKVDESLLGGVLVQTNKLIFDASLRTQLSRLETALNVK